MLFDGRELSPSKGQKNKQAGKVKNKTTNKDLEFRQHVNFRGGRKGNRIS